MKNGILQDYINHLRENGVVVLKIKVSASAKKTTPTMVLSDGTIKFSVQSPPEKNKANYELISKLAEIFKISKDHINFVSGQSQSRKIIKIVK